MSKLTELIEKVREENLTKQQLEDYHTEITYLDNLLRLEIAPLEKDEALFMNGFGDNPPIDKSVAQRKVMWKATEKGQRQIELSHYLKITPKLLQSLKTRLYSIY